MNPHAIGEIDAGVPFNIHLAGLSGTKITVKRAAIFHNSTKIDDLPPFQAVSPDHLICKIDAATAQRYIQGLSLPVDLKVTTISDIEIPGKRKVNELRENTIRIKPGGHPPSTIQVAIECLTYPAPTTGPIHVPPKTAFELKAVVSPHGTRILNYVWQIDVGGKWRTVQVGEIWNIPGIKSPMKVRVGATHASGSAISVEREVIPSVPPPGAVQVAIKGPGETTPGTGPINVPPKTAFDLEAVVTPGTTPISNYVWQILVGASWRTVQVGKIWKVPGANSVMKVRVGATHASGSAISVEREVIPSTPPPAGPVDLKIFFKDPHGNAITELKGGEELHVVFEAKNALDLNMIDVQEVVLDKRGQVHARQVTPREIGKDNATTSHIEYTGSMTKGIVQMTPDPANHPAHVMIFARAFVVEQTAAGNHTVPKTAREFLLIKPSNTPPHPGGGAVNIIPTNYPNPHTALGPGGTSHPRGPYAPGSNSALNVPMNEMMFSVDNNSGANADGLWVARIEDVRSGSPYPLGWQGMVFINPRNSAGSIVADKSFPLNTSLAKKVMRKTNVAVTFSIPMNAPRGKYRAAVYLLKTPGNLSPQNLWDYNYIEFTVKDGPGALNPTIIPTLRTNMSRLDQKLKQLGVSAAQNRDFINLIMAPMKGHNLTRDHETFLDKCYRSEMVEQFRDISQILGSRLRANLSAPDRQKTENLLRQNEKMLAYITHAAQPIEALQGQLARILRPAGRIPLLDPATNKISAKQWKEDPAIPQIQQKFAEALQWWFNPVLHHFATMQQYLQEIERGP
jgi:hypothetical protein